MKTLSHLLVLAGSQYAINVQDAEQFLGGVIFGLIQKDDLSEIKQCLTDAEGVEEEVNKAIEYFAKGDVQDILLGIEEMGKLLQELPTDLKECVAMKSDLERIETWAAIFKNPLELLKTVTTNLIKDYAKIFADVSKTTSDIGEAKYYNAGEDIADVLVLTLGAVPAKGDAEVQPENIPVTQW
uniref:Uncharacterized protein n=1 Tax=Strombidium rassoulzadegani TaxID=1082188 RepID=A0A7S3CRK9_9SPIT|mmetsp:Transcript_5555/g.9516  ORF Transcript_5555/g.9516 Transcript_5555/m.9516 type:complete len:183 (+) Transcript_5555:53-601(+)|eukprot:CAMPEP_0168613282 /NCGR_PEP_ID=MMETSP0449_2-20121227/3369_1 /TAXON_ID=1082188 /ORGANISM="Strombidium rassoulzadegani, Strain ras09" /LENGTH=182 /DNA_ID=CAMNT_0008653907 /DNA_START=32 /DNA_END=580 /DNA_ORIENTATION=-